MTSLNSPPRTFLSSGMLVGLSVATLTGCSLAGDDLQANGLPIAPYYAVSGGTDAGQSDLSSDTQDEADPGADAGHVDLTNGGQGNGGAELSNNGDGEGGDRGDDPVGLIINEVAPSGDPDDWVEIYNGTAQAIDLVGYWLSDDQTELDKGVFPDGTIIAPGEYLQIYLNDEWPGFKLGSDEEVVLSTPEGVVVDSADWDEGDAPEGGSWARSPDLRGDFASAETASPGQAN
ncbi:MAG: lamin tail domain-containing protein [Myxococcales bacterium]|nr:lamin tail domain-containing protein [Myxococcales bacterium]